MAIGNGNDDGGFDALRARLLLMFGGPMGFHLLYLREPLEAYVYFSTFGLFLIGVFVDALTLSSRIATRNKEIRMDEIENIQKVKIASTSFNRFIAQFLFGCWIGFLYCLAAILLVGSEHHLLLAVVIAAGVAQGVYVIGNCRRQQRSLIYIAPSAIISSVIAMLLFNLSLYRTILFTSISATFFGNRSARTRNGQKFVPGAYFILSSIHCFIVIIITIGLGRFLLDRRISVVTENGYSRVTASLGSIIRDRYFRDPTKDVFRDFARIEYLPLQRTTVLDKSWKLPSLFGTTHRNSSDEYFVLDYLAVLIVDFMRYSAVLSRRTAAEMEGPNALQLAVWRTFALQVLDVTPFVSDEKMQLECAKYLKNKKTATEGAQKDRNHWQYKTIKKACELLRSAVRKS